MDVFCDIISINSSKIQKVLNIMNLHHTIIYDLFLQVFCLGLENFFQIVRILYIIDKCVGERKCLQKSSLTS